MTYFKQRKCLACNSTFTIKGPRSRHCSAECSLMGRITKVDGCWIFDNASDYRALQFTWDGQHYGPRAFVLDLYNKPTPKGPIGTACGNFSCCNPDHLTEEAAFKTRKKRRTLTEDEVLRIAHGGEEMWAIIKDLGICSTTVQSIRYGRTHSALTGITTNPKKARE